MQQLCLCHFIVLLGLFSKPPVDESSVTSLGGLCKCFTHLESISNVQILALTCLFILLVSIVGIKENSFLKFFLKVVFNLFEDCYIPKSCLFYGHLSIFSLSSEAKFSRLLIHVYGYHLGFTSALSARTVTAKEIN